MILRSCLSALLFFTTVFFSLPLFADRLSVEDFVAPPDFFGASVSPDGSMIAGIWTKDDGRFVMVYGIEDEVLVNGTGDKVVRPFNVSWANNKKLLIKLSVPILLESAKSAAEDDDFDISDYRTVGRLVSYDIETGETIQLLADERGIKTNRNLTRVSHYLPEDPDHILMNASREGFYSQYKVNVNTGEGELVARAGKRTFGFINDEDGKLLYRLDYFRHSKYIKILRFISKNDWEEVERIYFDDEDQSKNKVDINGLVGRLDNSLVYRKLNEDTGFYELVRLVDGKFESFVSLSDRDVMGVIIRGIDSEVIGYRTLKDVYRSHYFDEKLDAQYQAMAREFSEQNFSIISQSSDKSVSIVLSSGVDNPASYYIAKNGQDLELLKYAYPTLPSKGLATGVKIQYQTRDKLLIDAYIFLPKEFDGNDPMPLVVLPHGGPHARDSLFYDDFAQFIATRGYIVAKANFRGSTGYGKSFQEAGYKQWGQAMQDDLEDLVKTLLNERLVAPQRICIVGASYGGYAALMGPIKAPEMYACSVSINGVTHLPKQIEFVEDKLDDDLFEQYVAQRIGDPDTEIQMLNAHSPALISKQLNVPVLLIHGEEDDVVPFEQSKIMHTVLKRRDKPVQFVSVKDAGHNIFYYRGDMRTVFEHVESFLNEHLK